MKRIVLLVFILAVFYKGYSQSLSPVVIATSGDFVQGQTYSIAWTLGEVVSETYAIPNIFLTQGFHQPSIKNDTSKIDPPFEFFNGFSPNGDGTNDWWNIPMLDKYTNNKVNIINRWGSEVWIMDNYDNKLKVFKGQNMNGDELPDGTYFYIIKYDNREKRGWVIIKR